MPYLIIDTRDRTNSTDSTSNFTIRLPNILQNVNYVKLKQVIMNHRIYNVSAEYKNNIFSYSEGSPISFSIIDGFYTPQQLATHIQNGMNNTSVRSNIYSVVYSETTFKYTITSTNNFSVTQTELSSLMGITQTTDNTLSIVTSDSVVLFDDPSYLLLDLNCFPMNTITTKNISTCFILPSNGSVEEYNGLMNQCMSFTSPINVQTFNVVLKNPDGSVVNLNGTNWIIVLEYSLSN